jgi:cold shock CspA family protein
MTERVRGHIRQFSHQRRCGFIRPGDGSPDIPVFLSNFCDTADASCVMPGDAVEFKVQQTELYAQAVARVTSREENGDVQSR